MLEDARPRAVTHVGRRFRNVQSKALCVELADDEDIHWRSTHMVL